MRLASKLFKRESDCMTEMNTALNTSSIVSSLMWGVSVEKMYSSLDVTGIKGRYSDPF